MKKSLKKHKKRAWLLIIAGLAAIIIGLWGWNQIAPRPLGNKLEYLGKKDSGGWFIKPSSTYYYGTDKTMDEIKTYFKEAKYDESTRDITGSSAGYGSRGMHFTSPSGNFIITYYSNPQVVIESMNLHEINRQFVISILDSKYQAAKDSL